MSDADSNEDSWYIGGLREEVERLRGKAVADELWLCLIAFNDRYFYADYHLQEVQRLVHEGLGGRVDAQSVFSDIVLGHDIQAQRAFHIPRRQAWAHVLACLQNMHAVKDIMAHALSFALALKVSGRVSMALIRKKVSDPVLAGMLTEWLDHPDHAYLNAAVNFSKHHSLVRETLSVDLTGTLAKPFGLKLASFRYGSRVYPEAWALNVMAATFIREAPAVTAIGRRVNQLLGVVEVPRPIDV